MLYLLSVILSVSLLLNPASLRAAFFEEKDARNFSASLTSNRLHNYF